MNLDWRDGFLFVGNELSLDFLNTRPLMGEDYVELLPDKAALLRWLAAAGFDPSSLKGKGPWEDFLANLRTFREKLRASVLRMEDVGVPEPQFIEDLNKLLRAYPALDQVVRQDSSLSRTKFFPLKEPADVYAPLVDSIATLLTLPDPSKLRKCESCVLQFHDTSKKGTRRWCSMNLCGNRAKVAAYTQRKRLAAGS